MAQDFSYLVIFKKLPCTSMKFGKPKLDKYKENQQKHIIVKC